jgi:NAD(P)H-hydrate epimerase
VLHPGHELAGDVSVADIGIPPEAAARVQVGCELLGELEARLLVPARRPDAHKGDAGRLLIVAGSPGKTGAANLALSGALRGGAGLVTLAARPEVLPLALSRRPEAMSIALHGNGPLGRSDLQALLAAAGDCDAVVVGPGIPRGPETGELLRALLTRVRIPVVLDADGLTHRTVEEVQDDRIGFATEAARGWRAVVVLKGAGTVVADADGPATIIPTGNAGLATGGTGDVLAGLVGALVAGGIRQGSAARAAAWVHGRAGDLAALRYGERGLLASDVVDAIGAVWAEWKR